MIKTLSTISAFVLAIAAGAASAAEEQQGGQPSSAAPQSGQSATEGQTGAQGANAQLEAAMRKCEQGPAADKQKCIDDAKKKHGQM